jgi:hypothetical protein
MLIADVSAVDEKPTIREKGMTAAERPRADRYRRECLGRRIPDVGCSELSPAQDLSISKQVQVEPDDRPGEWSAPLTCSGFVAHCSHCCRECRLSAG